MEYAILSLSILNIILMSAAPLVIATGYFIKHISKSECIKGKSLKLEMRPPTPPIEK